MKNKNRQQAGMAIVVAMIFLLVLTVLGITATNSSILSEKMNANMRDMAFAFKAAEMALGAGETQVQSMASAPNIITSCNSPPCNAIWRLNVLPNLAAQSNSWWQANGQAYPSTVANVAQQPTYIIELYSFTPYDLSPGSAASGVGIYYFRITARGVGATSNAIATVQSIYSTEIN